MIIPNRGLLLLMLLCGMAFGLTAFRPALAQPLETKRSVDVELRYVTVTYGESGEDAFVEIHWRLPEDHDAKPGDYFLLSTGEPVDTIPQRIPYVPGAPTYVFVDSLANPSADPVHYFVGVYDQNGASLGYTDQHFTSHLQTGVNLDICEQIISMEWDPYLITTSFGEPTTQTPIFNKTEILYSTNGGEEEIAIRQDFEGFTTFVFRDLSPGERYQFRIRSTAPDGRASYSNYSVEVHFEPDWPKVVQVESVSLVEGGLIQVRITADGSYNDLSYVIERSLGHPIDFSEIGREGGVQSTQVFRDRDANHETGPWFYRVSVINACENQVFPPSEPRSSLFLSMQLQQVLEAGFFVYYELEHHGGSHWGYNLTYKDADGIDLDYLNHESLFPPQGTLYFPIAMLERTGILYFRVEAVRDGLPIHSNAVLLSREPEVTAVNAFRPQSPIPENQVFRPGINIRPAAYELRIFNRWQQLVYHTLDPDDSWDGNFNGNPAPGGVYVWVLHYQLHGGGQYTAQGTVMLVR